MATKTTNYELTKPDAATEYYDINVQNGNMDKIDAALTPTADPDQAPIGNGPGKLVQWVSWLANRIKAITGKENWFDAPGTTLEAAKAHADAVAPHSGHETPAGAQSKATAAEISAKNYADTKETPAGAQAKANTAAATVQSDLNNHKADYVRQPAFGPTGGAANAYTFTSNPPLPALVDGVSAYLDIHAANTGASTLNWDGKGAKAIVNGKGAALTAGKLPLNSIVGVRYNASAGNFQLLGEGGEYGSAGAAQVLTGYTVGTENGLVDGTIPVNGDQSATLQITGASKPVKTIGGGHTIGGAITAELAPSLASVIKKGSTIGGVAGIYGNPPRDGLIGEYLFESISGNTVYDTSGFSRNGTATNVSYVAGKHGNAAYFNGSSKITLALGSAHFGSGTSPFTISLWVKFDQYPPTTAAVFRLDNGGGGLPCFIGLSANSNGYASVARGKTGWQQTDFSFVDPGKYRHIIIEYTGSVINIITDNTYNFSVAAPESVTDATTRYVSLGAVYDASTGHSNNLKGQIDSVRIYNRVLTSLEKVMLFEEVV